MFRKLIFVFAALFATGAAHAQAIDGRLKKILDAKSIAIAYRADAKPFSYEDDKKEPVGFTIDLCKAVVKSIEHEHKVQGGLAIRWVPVTVQTRFDAVAKGQADMECSSSTVTLSRLKLVDFSSYTFVESTGLIVRSVSGARSLDDLGNKSIAVVAGTSNERAVHEQVKRRKLKSTVVPFKTRDEAFAAVEAGKMDAFASDKLLLVGASMKAKEPGMLVMLSDDLSFEPYAIALPRGDPTFRLAVNTGLAQLYGSDEIVEIFRRWFGAFGTPSPLIQAVYLFGSIPE
jgi:glutamate/aspartate transport system substrate-binding protein